MVVLLDSPRRNMLIYRNALLQNRFEALVLEKQNHSKRAAALVVDIDKLAKEMHTLNIIETRRKA